MKLQYLSFVFKSIEISIIIRYVLIISSRGAGLSMPDNVGTNLFCSSTF